MTSYNQRGCFKCGGPFGGLYCRQCTCERCRRNYTDEVCALCCYEFEKSFVNDSNPNSFIDSLNIFNPPPQPQTYSCEFYGNNAHYGYDCPPQVPFIYNPEPCYNQDFDNDFPQKKQHQPEDIQELLHKLLKDFQMISEELAYYINTPNWNCLAFYEDDDEEYTNAITPVLLTEEPNNSLSMGDEHLSTISETESDELIKSSVENLVPIPSESEDFSDIENTLIISSPKIDSLLEEFSGELAHIDLIPPGINETDFDPEEEIRLVDKLYDSLMEEIDLFLTPDDSMPPGIENDDYDSEGDILFLEELLSNDPLSLPENESFHFDRYYVPSSPRPPEKPPDDDDEPDTGVFTKVVDDISDNSTRELYVHVPNVLPTLPTLSPMFDTLLPFSSENDDKVFNHGILASNEEKSPHLLSHRGFKAFQVIFDFSESPMMIYGGDSPILDVPFLHFYPP
ncbi:hypothetical protein Tco_0969049 [Tanacetum coccineum]